MPIVGDHNILRFYIAMRNGRLQGMKVGQATSGVTQLNPLLDAG